MRITITWHPILISLILAEANQFQTSCQPIRVFQRSAGPYYVFEVCDRIRLQFLFEYHITLAYPSHALSIHVKPSDLKIFLSKLTFVSAICLSSDE